MLEAVLDKVVDELAQLDRIEGIVLGGSRARGTHAQDSDVDIGIYYRPPLDLINLNKLATKLDQERRENLIGPVGSWL